MVHPTKNKPLTLLLIENSALDAKLIQARLKETGQIFEVTHVETLADGVEKLGQSKPDIVLLDLNLPDSKGISTVETLHQRFPELAVVVLTGVDDETIALEAVGRGAQDYLVKGTVDAPFLIKAIRYAMHRQRHFWAQNNLSLIDELTGLQNRRGFLSLAKQQLKLANRAKKPFILFFLDLDNLKEINDQAGHQEGDNALIETGELLKKTFRESDILGRIGGDEFVAMALDAQKKAYVSIIQERLRNNIALCNIKVNRKFLLALSIGAVYYDPKSPRAIETLLEEADALMYKEKQQKQKVKSTIAG